MKDIYLDDPVTVIAALTEFHDDDLFPPWSLLVAFSDPSGYGTVVMVIDDVPPDPAQDDRVRVLDTIVQPLRHHDLRSKVGGILLAHERPGSIDIRGHDLAWHDALVGAAQQAGLVMHGMYVMTDDGVARVVVPEPSVPS